MNKIFAGFSAVMMAFCVSMAACTQADGSSTPEPPSPPHNPVKVSIVSGDNYWATGYENSDTPVEACYKGIKYVMFPNGNATWGSVMYQNNGAQNPTVATCE